MQKPYAPKCGQGKTKMTYFVFFFLKIYIIFIYYINFQVMYFIPVKISTLYKIIINMLPF
jgi:hypothetical protein